MSHPSITETTSIIREATDEAKESLPLLNSIVEIIESINVDVIITAAASEEQAASIDEISTRMVQISNLQEDIRAFGNDTSRDIHNLGLEITRFRNEITTNNNVQLSSISLLLALKSRSYFMEMACVQYVPWLRKAIAKRRIVSLRLSFREMVYIR